MDAPLYERFSKALRSLPEADLPDALDCAEYVVNQANLERGMDSVFPHGIATGRPVDRILRVFAGHTLTEVAQVMGQLRHEIADVVAQRGAPADVVRELREGGPEGKGNVAGKLHPGR